MKNVIGGTAIFIGLICLLFGAILYFGGMMSDSPEAGSEVGAQGCAGAGVGAALIAFGIWMVL